MNGCRAMRTAILRELDRELPLDRAIEIDEHVGSCAACRAFLERAGALEELLHALGEPPLERVDVERNLRAISARIRDETRLHLPQPGLPRPGLRRLSASRLGLSQLGLSQPGRIALVAAAIALVAYLAALFATRDRQPHAPTDVDDVASTDATTHGTSIETARVEGVAPVEGAGELPALGDEPQSDDEPVLDDEPAFDAQRLARARISMRELLASAGTRLAPGATSADALGFADEIDAARRGSTLEGWPATRLVATLIRDEDPTVARAALRYLGVRGDRLALFAIEERIDGGALEQDALLALLDLGEPGVEALARTLGNESSRAAAIAGLARWPHERAIRALHAALSLRGASQALVVELGRFGAPAVKALLTLANSGAIDLTLTLDVLATMPDAPHVLGEMLLNGVSLDAELAFAACARLQPETALPWLAERCRSGDARAAAFDCLAAYAAPAALDLRLDLMRERDTSDAALQRLARDLVGRGEERLIESVQRCAQTPERAALLLDALIASGEPEVIPGLAQFACAAELPATERELALRAIGDVGERDDAHWLTDVLAQLGDGERRLVAVCVDALHRLGGDEAVARALANAPRRRVERVLAVLRQRSPQSLSLVQLARALDLTLERELSPAQPERP